MKAVTVLLIILMIFFIIERENSIFADNTVFFQDTLESPMSQNMIKYDFTEKDKDYEESPLRRFEIIFLISMPVSLLFSFLGVQAYRGISGKSGGFTSIEYQYLVLSTLGISLTIALKDQRAIFYKERF